MWEQMPQLALLQHKVTSCLACSLEQGGMGHLQTLVSWGSAAFQDREKCFVSHWPLSGKPRLGPCLTSIAHCSSPLCLLAGQCPGGRGDRTSEGPDPSPCSLWGPPFLPANFTLPDVGDFLDEVLFIELQREEADKLVRQYNEEGRKAGPPPEKRFDNRGGGGGFRGRGGGGSFQRYDNRGPPGGNRGGFQNRGGGSGGGGNYRGGEWSHTALPLLVPQPRAKLWDRTSRGQTPRPWEDAPTTLLRRGTAPKALAVVFVNLTLI